MRKKEKEKERKKERPLEQRNSWLTTTFLLGSESGEEGKRGNGIVMFEIAICIITFGRFQYFTAPG
jgi:hypothetical protein